MAHWVCLLRGHRRTPVVFATNRFYCRRCGIALDPDPAPALEPPATLVTTRRAVPEPLAALADPVASGSRTNTRLERAHAREYPRRSAAGRGVPNRAGGARF